MRIPTKFLLTPEILCRLEDGTLLPVVQRDRLHVVERESSQIDRTVLCVSQLDAVVEHTYMVGSHTPDIHRFQSPLLLRSP